MFNVGEVQMCRVAQGGSWPFVCDNYYYIFILCVMF